MSNQKSINSKILYLIEKTKKSILKEFPDADPNNINKISLLMLRMSRSVVPMYIGNLNPDWEIYNETINFLEEQTSH